MWPVRRWPVTYTLVNCTLGPVVVVYFVKVNWKLKPESRNQVGQNCCQYECKNLQSNLPAIDFTKFEWFDTDENGCTKLIGCSKRSYCTLLRDHSGCERCECEQEDLEITKESCPALKKCNRNCKYGERWKLLFYKCRKLSPKTEFHLDKAFKRMPEQGAKFANAKRHHLYALLSIIVSRKKVSLDFFTANNF